MTSSALPYSVSGYVLAGGKSSRMGRDKALLELAGKPLIAHAVTKLRRLCAEVAILSAKADLAAFAPLVPDLHPGCGPLGGIEAALTHAHHPWSLILPVDVPFLPSSMLQNWVSATLAQARQDGTRLAIFVVDGKPQPALLLIHRDLAPYVSKAICRGELKLLPVLSAAAEDLALQRNVPLYSVLCKSLLNTESRTEHGVPSLCFANLNTPEDLAEAERHADQLEP